MLTFGSLFSGVGGFDLGLERAGMTCRWQVEIDPFCRRVLAKHWPDVARFEDVREVGAHNLAPVDLICGGFPCQDISNAGRRAGIEGERSGLWSEYARIIGELRPRYVLVENVAALLARGLERVLGDLAESGYDAEWDCIPAAAVGAPHRRDRLYLIAYPSIQQQPGQQPIAIAGRGHAPDAPGNGAHRPVADDPSNGRGPGRARRPDSGGKGEPVALRPFSDAIFAGLEGHERGVVALANVRRSNADASGSGWWSTEPDVGRVADGVPARVDRLRSLGNAVVPQVAEWIGRRIVEAVA